MIGKIEVRLDPDADNEEYVVSGTLQKTQIFCNNLLNEHAWPGDKGGDATAVIETKKKALDKAYATDGQVARNLNPNGGFGYTKKGHCLKWVYNNAEGRGIPPLVFQDGTEWQPIECRWIDRKGAQSWDSRFTMILDNDDGGAKEGDYLWCADESARKFSEQPKLYMMRGMVGRILKIATGASIAQAREAVGQWLCRTPGGNLSGGAALPIWEGYGKKAVWMR